MTYELIVVLNNVSSPQRLLDTVKVVLSAKQPEVKALVITKASGMAAQAGVPDASRMTYKQGKPLIVLPALKDAIELLKPEDILIYAAVEGAEDLNNTSIQGKRIMIVVDGSDNGPSRTDLALGKTVSINEFSRQLPPAAAAAILMRELNKRMKDQRNKA